MKATAAGEHTKRLLTDSLKLRMAEKPLNRISIKEITDGCQMQRQTFYYHFEDIYDQVKWLYQQEFVSLMDGHDGPVTWQEGLLNAFRYVDENRQMCLCTLHSIGREH